MRRKAHTGETEQKKVVFDLMALAAGPPDPQVKPKLQAALERFVPDQAKRAEANPVIRANSAAACWLASASVRR